MPRAKVDPAKRLRAAEACTYCQSSKKRCSAVVPCTNCVRKGRAHTCTLSRGKSDGQPSVASRKEAVDLKAQDERKAAFQQLFTVTSDTRSNAPISPSATTTHSHVSTALAATSPEAAHRTRARILQGAEGERVYIGGSASLSFLQFIRDTVSQYVGPSPFSSDARNTTMHEDTTVQTPMSPVKEEDISLQLKLQLIDTYFRVTSGYVDVISRTEVENSVQPQKFAAQPYSICRIAITDLVLAIGAQCSKPDPNLSEIEKFYFSRGQQRAFSTMLRNPSVDMISVFLLMSFYMLGACHRNAASMYLGVAARAAAVLGLQHQESYSSSSATEQDQQSRVWISLRILDLLVSAILARPSGTISPPRDSDPLLHLAQGDKTDLAAQYRLASIIDQIVDKVYGQKSVSPATAENLLEQLKQWANTLPQGLQAQSTQASAQNPAAALSNLSLACTYYFAVTLTTRPFLISTLTSRMAGMSQGLSNVVIPEQPVHSELASVCVDSAVWLIRACLEASKNELLLSNMCIMKALVFAAALILGFSSFAHVDVDFETDAMFSGAREILQMFSVRSSQAAYYHEILTSLNQTLMRQRQQLALQSRRRSNNYVGQLFKASADTLPPVQEQGYSASPADYMNEVMSATKFSDLDLWMQNQPEMSLPQQTDVPATDLFGWDSLDLGLWDNFPYVSQHPS